MHSRDMMTMIELITFSQVGGDIDHKIEMMIKNGVDGTIERLVDGSVMAMDASRGLVYRGNKCALRRSELGSGAKKPRYYYRAYD